MDHPARPTLILVPGLLCDSFVWREDDRRIRVDS